MRQCFAVEVWEDNEWKVAFLVRTHRREVESKLPGYALHGGCDLKDIRARWVWTQHEAIALQDIGVPIYTAFSTQEESTVWVG